MTSAWRPFGPPARRRTTTAPAAAATKPLRTEVGLEVGDEAAGGLPTAGRAVGLQQVGRLCSEADRAVVADVRVHVRVEHLPAGHGLEEALAGEVPTGGFEHLVEDL